MNIFWIKVKKFFGAPLTDLERLALHNGPVIVAIPPSSTVGTAPPTSIPTPTAPAAPSLGGTPAGSPPILGAPTHKWDGSVVLGVDTSHYQEAMTLADWKELFARGFRWMYPKAVDGASGPDSYLDVSKKLAAAAGFIVFAGYCFFRFDLDGIAQARALVKATGGVKSGEGPLVVDVEWDNKSADPGYHDSDHGGTRQLIDAKGEEKVYACLCEIERLTGITPWIYGSYGFIKFAKPARFARFPFIVANYSAKLGDGAVPLPAPWKQEIARQYSGHLTAGKTVEIDGDRFLGTLEQLKGYVKV